MHLHHRRLLTDPHICNRPSTASYQTCFSSSADSVYNQITREDRDRGRNDSSFLSGPTFYPVSVSPQVGRYSRPTISPPSVTSGFLNATVMPPGFCKPRKPSHVAAA